MTDPAYAANLRSFHKTRVLLTLAAVGVFSLYVISNQLAQGRPAATLRTPLDDLLPFVPWTEVIYLSVYLFLLLPVVHVKHPTVFRRTAYAFYTHNLLCLLIFLVFPVRMERAEFPIDGLWTWGVAFNYAYDPPYNNFPSLHVANAMFAGYVAYGIDRPVGIGALMVGAGISVSTLLVKQHWVVDVIAGNAFGLATYWWIVRPSIPKDAPREELAYPQRNAWLLVAIYGVIVSGIIAGYYAGWQPFAWPLPKR